MNTSTDKPQQPQEPDVPKQKKESIFKNYWFITLILILVIAIGFVIVLLLLRDKSDKNGTQINNKTIVEYTIKNTNITIPIKIGGSEMKIDIIRDDSIEDDVRISSSLLKNIRKNHEIQIYTNDNRCRINGPIMINNISINNIEATIIDAKEDIFQITDKYFTDIFGKISIKDDILEIARVNVLSEHDKSILWVYSLVISLIVYLVCIFLFSETIVITYNKIDKYVLIITGIALALYGIFAKEFAGSEFVKWLTYIAITAGAITLLFTLIGNLPNPLYTLLGLIAKVFIIYFITLMVMLIICIAIVVLFFAIVSSSANENKETWEIDYDAYLDKFIAVRRW